MSDEMSEAERIRQKRLAKLGGPPRQPPATGSPSGASDPDATPSADSLTGSTALSDTAKATHQQTPTANPFAQLGMQPTSNAAPKINITPSKPAAQIGEKRSHSASRGGQRQSETLEAWEDRTLSALFRLSLDPDKTEDHHGHKLHYLEGVKDDLQEQHTPVRLSTSVLDSALLEAASNPFEETPLDYLLGCWKRVSRLFRGMKSDGQDTAKYNVVKEARRLCMSYCIFAATIPDMFGVEAPDDAPLAKHLLVDPENERGLCHDFLTEAISRFDDDESIKTALIEGMERLSQDLSKMSMNDDFRPYMLALRNFVAHRPLAIAITQSSHFLTDSEPQLLELETMLGPFFRLSPTQSEVALNYFSSPATRDKAYIANSQKALRMSLQTHQNELFDITNCIVKASAESRERILNWFALMLNKNHKRRGTYTDPKTVATDGVMLNITACLDRLCEPFMDATFSKIHRIEVEYLRRNPRIDIDDETKINADQETSDRYYSQKAEGTNNFISEAFFLTVAAHHYGTEAANTKLATLQREIKHLEKQLENFESERHKYAGNPAQLRLFESHVQRFRKGIESGQCVIHATQGVLLDELAQARSMQFMRYVIVWMTKLVRPQIDFPREELPLPLPEEQPDAFSCLPEYFLEDIVDNFKFITRNMPQIITSTQCEELVVCCITFLRSSEYIKNPYLKSGLITVLFNGVWPFYNHSKGIFGDMLNAKPFCLKHLLHALMKFYIECESTGSHTQFFDKFNIRYEIFQIIRCIWSNVIYRQNLAREARVNTEFFVRFVNLLLNDVTFVLDESFTAFNTIRDIGKELSERDSSMDQQVRQEKEEALKAAQDRAKSYMQLTNETVSMLQLFTEALADSFTKPEIVQRLADMLDYNLDSLVGKKQINLKVDNPQEYNFDPKKLLGILFDVYLNLRQKENFVLAIARDGRSYKPENFKQAKDILQRYAPRAPGQIQAWDSLAAEVAKAKAEDEQAEEDLGEIPDEFLDPLVYTLMEDPVILPTSKTTIDRSTIRSHLLSDPTDPFNRSPLKIEDVVDDVEMKAKIDAFKREKTKGRREMVDTTANQTGAGDVMDLGS